MLANSIAYVPFTYLQAVGRPDLTAKAHLVELPVHTLLASLFVWQFGMTGAALAWTVRVTVDVVLLFAIASRTTDLSFRSLMSRELRLAVVLTATLALAMALLVGWMPHKPAYQLLVAGFALMIVLPTIARISSTPTERAVLFGALRNRST